MMIAGSSAAVSAGAKRRVARASASSKSACRPRPSPPTTMMVARSGSRSRISATFGQFVGVGDQRGAPESARRYSSASGPNSTNSGTAISADAVGGEVRDRGLGRLRQEDRHPVARREAACRRARWRAASRRRGPREGHPVTAAGLVLVDQREASGSLGRVAVDGVGGDVVAGRDVPAGVAPELVVGRHAPSRAPVRRAASPRLSRSGRAPPGRARRRCPDRSAR